MGTAAQAQQAAPQSDMEAPYQPKNRSAKAPRASAVQGATCGRLQAAITGQTVSADAAPKQGMGTATATGQELCKPDCETPPHSGTSGNLPESCLSKAQAGVHERNARLAESNEDSTVKAEKRC